MGVHVAHQDLMPVAADQFADIGQLAGAGTGSERQVHHHHHDGVLAFADAQQHRAAAAGARQRVILQQAGTQPAEHAIAVLGQMAKIAIELLVPVGEGAEVGQVFDLVDIAGTQAAAIGFLQGDQVVVGEQIADALQVAGAPVVGQQVLPATCQVVMVTLGIDTDLDIEAEQTQASAAGPVVGRSALRVDLWITQASLASARPATQHARHSWRPPTARRALFRSGSRPPAGLAPGHPNCRCRSGTCR
ncbi:hypothetical protein FQZ97_904640 [compost metagenome]